MNRFIRKNLAGYAFLTPWLVGFLLLAIGPILFSLYLSFTKYNVINPPQWIGLDNFEYMFGRDARFRKALQVTFTFVAFAVPAKLVFALAVAMVLDKGIRAIGIYRALFYLPSILGGSIAVAILWRQLFNADGVVNSILALLGIEGPYWLADPRYSLWTLIVLAVWQFGSPMLVLQMIEAFKSFSGAFIISGGSGAPLDSLLFYTVYLFNEAFSFLRMGYASALAWVLLVIIATFTAIAFWTSKYWVHYEGERG